MIVEVPLAVPLHSFPIFYLMSFPQRCEAVYTLQDANGLSNIYQVVTINVSKSRAIYFSLLFPGYRYLRPWLPPGDIGDDSTEWQDRRHCHVVQPSARRRNLPSYGAPQQKLLGAGHIPHTSTVHGAHR